MKTEWPTSAEMQSFFESQGLTFSDTALLDTAVSAAVQRWEMRTGFKPFRSTTSATYKFDPPQYGGGVLDLKGGFVSVTAVRTGIAYQDTGDLLTEGRDYQLRPLNAAEEGVPYSEIYFLASPGAGPASISVTGERGYSDGVPEDAWLAVRGDAFAQIVFDILEGYSVAQEETQGPVKVKYDNDQGRSKIDRMQKAAKDAAARYKRVYV